MQIRRVLAADAAELADLYLRARRAAEPAIPPMVHTDAETHEWMAGQVEALDVWVVVDGERIIGLLILAGGWLDQLYVDPTVTGQGIGSSLVDLAKDQQPEGLQLWTFASNVGAQRFYERHGFEAVERTDGSDNEEGAPDIRYVWSGVTRGRG